LDSGARASIGIGRYVLGERLGQGGLGVVHAAHDPQLRRDVAIKLIHAHNQHPRAEERLLREARAIARLNHPNVVQVFDVGSFERESAGPSDDLPTRGLFVVMQRLEGQTVEAWLQTGPAWEDVLAVFLHAARGLIEAHDAGVVHRDLKPANIFLCSDGVVKVLDFGLAKVTLESEVDRLRVTLRSSSTADDSFEEIDIETTDAGIVIGTPAYMAPEQHVGDVTDPAADQFAFCAALYRALFGIHPFAGSTPRELARAKWAGRIVPPRGPCAVPSWVEDVLRRGLAAAPTKRWPTMQRLVDALERRRRKPTLRRLAGAGIVAGAIGFALPSDATSTTAADPTEASSPPPASAPPHAEPQFERLAPSLDVLVRSWSRQQVAASR
jgi:serine/threonine protein kinase